MFHSSTTILEVPAIRLFTWPLSIIIVIFCGYRKQITPEGLLYREIMSNYDKNTRPIINASHVVNINLTFTFSQVLDVVS